MCHYNIPFLFLIGRSTDCVCDPTAHHVERIFAPSFGLECHQSLRAGTSKVSLTSAMGAWVSRIDMTYISFLSQNIFWGHTEFSQSHVNKRLVTQPMMQRQPNPTELRSMDSYIQILCRFQKSKRKIPPPSPLSTKKSPFTRPLLTLFLSGNSKNWDFTLHIEWVLVGVTSSHCGWSQLSSRSLAVHTLELEILIPAWKTKQKTLGASVFRLSNISS